MPSSTFIFVARTDCNEAHKINFDISIEDRKTLRWPPTRKKMRYDGNLVIVLSNCLGT